MKQQIIDALQNSTVSNQQVIKAVEETIRTLSETENYSLSLMQIADDQTVSEQIRLASLIQLKVNVERRWVPLSNKVKPLGAEEKVKIRQTLLTAMIRCQTMQPLVRTYKRIVTLITIMDYKTWSPASEIIQVLQTQPQNTNITILFISSFIQAFSDRAYRDESFEQLQQFQKQILPILHQIMTGERKTIPVIYLVTKTLEKVFKVQMNETVRAMIPTWMPILKEIIDHQQSTLSISNTNQKQTIDSCFFRAKKWAAKIINKFFTTHASTSYKKQNASFAQQWINAFASGFIKSLMGAIVSPNLPKTYFYVIKSIQIGGSRHPQLVEQYAQSLMFTILPEFVKPVPADQQLINDDPYEVLKKQDDIMGISGDPKMAAASLWASLADLKSDVKKSVEGMYLKKSLEWIYQQLCSSDFIIKETALTLLSRTKYAYVRFGQIVNKPITQIIQKSVAPLLQSDINMLKIKAIEIFQSYGYLQFSPSLMPMIVQNIYKCLSEKGKVLVNIKAAGAFNALLSHPSVLEMVKPYLRDLLQFYIKLISQHEIQNLVACLQGIVEHYAEEIDPFAIQLITYLSSQFRRFSDGNNEAEDTNDGQLELAAYACIDVIKQIISANISKDVLEKLDEPILQILQESFTHEGNEYLESALQLLAIYLNKVDKMNQKFWFFYYCIIYSINGLPQQLRSMQIPSVFPKQKRIIDSLPSSYNYETYDMGMNCIRLFIYKSPALGLQEKDIFGLPPLYNIFKIFEEVLSKPKKLPESVLNCIALIINILQNTKSSQHMINASWKIIVQTFESVKSISGQKMGISGICLCLFSNTEATVKILESQPGGFNILNNIIQAATSFRQQYEISRIIVGMSSIFMLEKRSEELDKHLPNIFKLLYRMILELSEKRQTLDLEEQEEYDEPDANSINYWNEQRSKFKTVIDSVDVAAFFESVWKHFSAKEPTVSEALTALLSSQEKKLLEENLNTAKAEFIKGNKKQ